MIVFFFKYFDAFRFHLDSMAFDMTFNFDLDFVFMEIMFDWY